MNKQIKVAVVTGGTRGIGGAISLAFAKRGYKVFAIYARDKAGAESIAKKAEGLSGELICLRGDLTREEKMQEVVDAIRSQVSHIDCLIHSAASGVHKSVDELSTKHLRWTFEVNVFAFHELFLRLKDLLIDGSRVIGLSSAGSTRCLFEYAAVGSSKGALDALFRHYAVELAPRGIAVNLVAPGMIETEALKAFSNRESRIEAAREGTPTKRLTDINEVASLVMFLCSPEARQIVGQTLIIDGGRAILA
jgi:enoyl-[acyl-carrier protein] reductase III